MASEMEFGSDVEDLGSALGAAIEELPEYQAFQAAQQAVESSTEAQQKIEEFESKRESLMVAKQLGNATQDDVAELRAIQDELHAIPVMEDFLEAQQELDERLAALNTAISNDLEIDFASQAGSCCHD